MACKPAHWILRLALGLSLPAVAAVALATENMPTLAKLPSGDSEVSQAVANESTGAASPVATISAPADATPLSAADEPVPAEEAQDSGVEVIKERYPNSAVKVERHVTQDAEGNYYNHGLWTQWDEKGRLVGSGEYRYGKRHGRWLRWYAPNEAPMLQGPLYKDFQAPFVAEATFEDGVLHGTWKVFDAKNRKVSEWEFDHGDRQGKSVWFYNNGQKRREVDYRQGQIDGEVLEWGPDYKLALREKYVDGRRLAPQVDYFAADQKRAEGWILFAKENIKSNYDFWAGTAAIQVVGTEGVNQRHGLWTWWHKNGQKQMEGRYEADLPIGKFTWWYPNGQKQLAGEYISGKQQGKFTWWHQSGQKQLEGAYIAGVLSGKWTRWNADGHVVEVGDYSADGKQQLAHEPRSLDTVDAASAPTLEAVQPPPATSSRLKR
jgi:antitoxin component YwqK of YwqJK toxin-antitoxin module